MASAFVEQQVAVQLIGDHQQVVALDQFGQAFELFDAPDPPGRVVGLTPQQQPGLGGNGRFERRQVEPLGLSRRRGFGKGGGLRASPGALGDLEERRGNRRHRQDAVARLGEG